MTLTTSVNSANFVKNFVHCQEMTEKISHKRCKSAISDAMCLWIDCRHCPVVCIDSPTNAEQNNTEKIFRKSAQVLRAEPRSFLSETKRAGTADRHDDKRHSDNYARLRGAALHAID